MPAGQRAQRPKVARQPVRARRRRVTRSRRRLEALAKRVRDGTYQVDAEALARQMLERWSETPTPLERALAEARPSDEAPAGGEDDTKP